MRRPVLALLAALAVGCDFSPTLDVPLPDFAPALTITGTLVADSTAEVRVTVAADPYAPDPYESAFPVPDGAVVTLSRDGAAPVPLALRSETCRRSLAWTQYEPYECGAFAAGAVIEPGATYTVRASAPGFPAAEATVTVPRRVPASVAVGASTERALPGDGTRLDTDVTLTLRDPAGPQRYGLLVIREPYSYEDRITLCDDDASSCRDTTLVERVDPAAVGYTTTDPVLLAGARTVPATGTRFITFTDEVFDGRDRSFRLRAQQIWYPSYNGGPPEPPVGVWLVAADPTTFGAYQIAWFSGGEGNPFAEPADLPSNVTGGYGLLGAVAITEARAE